MRVVIAGIGKNVAQFVPALKNNIKRYASLFEECVCVFVESNSQDNTYEKLKSINEIVPTYVRHIDSDDIHLNMSNELKLINSTLHRIPNITRARNECIDIIKCNYSSYDIVLFLDLDDVNMEPVNRTGINSCFIRSDWDMVCANVGYKYYDIYALRCEGWNESCYLKDIKRSVDSGNKVSHAVKKHLLPKFHHIPQNKDWIKVQSAFGGAAFVKMHAVQNNRFGQVESRNTTTKVTKHSDYESEWKRFCMNVENIYINPQWIIQKLPNLHVIAHERRYL